MATYKCSKCEALCNSKCIGQRSTFMEDETQAYFRSILSFKIIPDEGRRYRNDEKPDEPIQGMDLEVRFTLYPDKEEHTKLKAFEKFRNVINDPRFKPEVVLCSHRWEIQDDECDLGCCKRKETSDNASV